MVSHYDRLIRLASRTHVPLGALFEVTHRCNLGCAHCYLTEGPVGRPKPTREELTLDEIRPVLDDLARLGTLFLTLSGGEVFMRRDFLGIVAHARARGFSVTVFTTGTLLTPETARELAALHPLSVEVSIYSARPEVHDRVTRIPGSHARSLRALRLLKERGVVILIKSPLMSLNSGEYHGIVELAEELGAGYGFDPMLIPCRDGDMAPLALSPDREQLRAFFSDPVLSREHFQPVTCLPQPGEEICATGRRTCLISPYGDVFPCGVHPIPAGNLTPVALSPSRDQMRAFFSDPVLAKELHQPVRCLPQKGEEICGTGRRTCMISPYGDVFPCGIHPVPAGSLREQSFHEIWTGSPLLRELRSKTVDDLRNGAKLGGFRCSALALIEHGDFLGPFRRGAELDEIQAEAIQAGVGNGGS